MKLSTFGARLLLGMMLLWPLSSWGQADSPGTDGPQVDLPTLVLRLPVKNSLDLQAYFQVLVDSSDQMLLPEARKAQGYQPYDSLDYPLDLGHRLWARTRLVNATEREMSLFLFTGSSDSVVLYLQGKDSLRETRTGNYISGHERAHRFGPPVGMGFTLAAEDSCELYLLMTERVGVGPQFQPKLFDFYRWWTSYLSKHFSSNLLYGLFVGALFILFVYNLIIFFSTRVRTYLYYALYLLSVLIGLHFEMLIRQFPAYGFSDFRINRYLILLGFNGASAFYLMFGRSLVETWALTPRWDKALLSLVGVRAAISLVGVVGTVNSDFLGQLLDFSITWYAVEGLALLLYFGWLIRSRSRIAWFFIIGSLLVFGGGFFPVFLANSFGWQLNVPNLLLSSILMEILVFSLGLGYKMRSQQRAQLEAEQALNRELSKVNTAFGRFVPHEFIHSLGYESVLQVKLGDQVEKEVTVLFADIRGYTSLAEQMTPAENFQFLNAYLGRLGPPIQEHGGFVNQYYGDGIMALFLKEPTSALRAAVAMQQALGEYNAERQAKGRSAIRVGIGLHTGSLMMGIIGDTLRLEAGVVSDTVNTASRMEGLTKYFGVDLVLSETTVQRLGEGRDFGLRFLGRVLVKGRRQPTAIYECYDGDRPDQRDRKAAVQEEFEQGLQAYLAGDFARALRAWESVRQGLPGDPPTQHYVALAQRYLSEGTPEDWEGVEVMLMK